MEREPEESLLPTRENPVGDVEEDDWWLTGRREHLDDTATFEDKQASAPIPAVGHVERIGQPGRDQVEASGASRLGPD
jgi:hypothetical protein